MRTTIDAGGRIVVPKRYRDLLGLAAGQEVDIELDGSGLHVAPVSSEVEIREVGGVTVAGRSGVVVEWTPAQERELLDALRDRRL